jgi:hypothetical protein
VTPTSPGVRSLKYRAAEDIDAPARSGSPAGLRSGPQIARAVDLDGCDRPFSVAVAVAVSGAVDPDRGQRAAPETAAVESPDVVLGKIADGGPGDKGGTKVPGQRCQAQFPLCLPHALSHADLIGSIRRRRTGGWCCTRSASNVHSMPCPRMCCLCRPRQRIRRDRPPRPDTRRLSVVGAIACTVKERSHRFSTITGLI